ncbi:phenylacetate--CoA ligase family protein [uncultured Polaribacter sp.]|uniref:phenylacetate--CoA ligase family protein n=1 Tax=uncultured Polaribacter sp. TaxID=174711 RepID=UPI002638A76F|nr:phenylacetate--CoA ligase family protein [uncultured Polaribacter sp.]
MIKKIIYILGQNHRNPTLKTNYEFLKKSEKWPLEKLEEYQLKKLQKLLNTAYNHSEFYRLKYDELKVDINDIKSLEDLKKIPVTTKNDLINFTDKIQTNLKFKKTFLATTSGSSGESLRFFRDEHADSFNRASIERGYSWFGIKPWERNGYFWGFNFSASKQIKNKFLDFLQNRFRIFSYEEKALKSFIKKSKKAKYIHGYSSMIYHTAVLINKLNLSKPKNIKLIKGTSEKVFDSYKPEIKKAFGIDIISEYGATESGIIAFECKNGNMHLNMEGVVVEQVDDEILVTNLQMLSFPIIRYKLGDYISLAPRDKKCSCGKEHLILEEVTGRIGENVYGFKNTYPSLYFYYIFKNLSKKEGVFLNYQVIQNKEGNLVFLIEGKINIDVEKKLINEIVKYFKKDINFEIKQQSNFVYNKGKLKNFISKINE